MEGFVAKKKIWGQNKRIGHKKEDLATRRKSHNPKGTKERNSAKVVEYVTYRES